MSFKANPGLLLGSALLGLASIATPAAADPSRAYGHSATQVTYDYARVLSATPIVRQVEVQTPVRECYQETVERRTHRNPVAANPGRAIAGGVIGGVIGNQFGSGRGNDAATIVGALLGASIGANGGREGGGYTVERYPVERCDVRYESRYEERIEGYDVRYVYNGQTLSTRTDYDPGERIKVRVTVAPSR
ncbi:MAG: glycine zipper 2TM domain-containing protein [Pseudomonadota bacterium]